MHAQEMEGGLLSVVTLLVLNREKTRPADLWPSPRGSWMSWICFAIGMVRAAAAVLPFLITMHLTSSIISS